MAADLCYQPLVLDERDPVGLLELVVLALVRVEISDERLKTREMIVNPPGSALAAIAKVQAAHLRVVAAS